MDEIQKRKLGWFFDFLNYDLDNLIPTEVLRLSFEIGGILLGSFPGDEMEPFTEWYINLIHSKKVKNGSLEVQLQLCQNRLSEFINEMMESIRLESSQRSKAIVKNGKATLVLDEKPPEYLDLGHFETPVIIEANLIKPDDTYGLKETIIRINYRAETSPDTLLFIFLQSLDNVPLGAINKCPECENWFLHASKRTKIYCSNKCAARVVSRRKREKIKKTDEKTYKQELENGAKRARKSYERKVKARTPGAKPDRRPRKHK